ncbi:alkaline phosphatase D family protein [Amycolatopsis xylanica]|uniref:alkaline phosphatase D family protein n=1 Tax=Amycolatopsis xylanica TaxID=589385 RepID=UPI001FE1C63E|nr:alkaline phosphatase D family protein [Amycolatopsis xylanica]
MSRRTVLLAAGATVAVALPGKANAETPAFAHGVASGDPLPDSVLLWTRLTPSADATPGSGLGPSAEVGWEVAADAGFRRVVACGRVCTGPDRDHTVKVSADGLRPSTGYFYRFTFRGQSSPVGRTRTAPRHNAAVDRLRFGFVSCANWHVGYFGAYRYLAEREDLDAVIHLGDYIYEMAGDATALRQSLPPHELETLADYRQRHALYKTDPHVQRMHARHPMIATWDDHEAADNAWSGGSTSHDPATEGDWAVRKAAAHRAYFEWMPVRNAGERLYRRLRFGKLADLTMLDLRSYRTEQPKAPGDNPEGTILGAEQREWFIDGLVHSHATWRLVGNSVMISPLKLPALPDPRAATALHTLLADQPRLPTADTDIWDGYLADRTRVLNTLDAHGITDTVFLTGDIHTSWASNVPLDSGRSVATEFVCTSVTSDNFDELFKVPPRTVSLAIEAELRKLNPHVQYVELDSHGPCVLEVTPAATQVDWYYLLDKKNPDSALRHGASYKTLLGDAHVQATTPLDILDAITPV